MQLHTKGAIVLYMNIRPVRTGFPRDEIPSKISTEDLGIPCKFYEARCSAFFAAIFRLLNSEFSEEIFMDTTEAIFRWNKRMFRGRFFTRMELEYDRVG